MATSQICGCGKHRVRKTAETASFVFDGRPCRDATCYAEAKRAEKARLAARAETRLRTFERRNAEIVLHL